MINPFFLQIFWTLFTNRSSAFNFLIQEMARFLMCLLCSYLFLLFPFFDGFNSRLDLSSKKIVHYCTLLWISVCDINYRILGHAGEWIEHALLILYRAPTDFRPLRHIFVHFLGLPTAFMLYWQHYQVKRKCRQRPKWDSCFGISQNIFNGLGIVQV